MPVSSVRVQAVHPDPTDEPRTDDQEGLTAPHAEDLRAARAPVGAFDCACMAVRTEDTGHSTQSSISPTARVRVKAAPAPNGISIIGCDVANRIHAGLCSGLRGVYRTYEMSIDARAALK